MKREMFSEYSAILAEFWGKGLTSGSPKNFLDTLWHHYRYWKHCSRSVLSSALWIIAIRRLKKIYWIKCQPLPFLARFRDLFLTCKIFCFWSLFGKNTNFFFKMALKSFLNTSVQCSGYLTLSPDHKLEVDTNYILIHVIEKKMPR